MADKNTTPWLVFFGTNVALVEATSERDAYMAWLDKYTETHDGRRFVTPAPEEVRCRPLRPDDRDWIEQTGNEAFRKAFKTVGSA